MKECTPDSGRCHSVYSVVQRIIQDTVVLHSIPDCMYSKLTHATQAKLCQVETSDGIFSHTVYVHLPEVPAPEAASLNMQTYYRLCITTLMAECYWSEGQNKAPSHSMAITT